MDVYDPRDLGQAIRRLRKGRGWTQAELAEWLGVNPVTVGRMEQGKPVAMTIAVRAVSLLGARLVVVSKAARVVVQEPDDLNG
jgi:transcriptional regulator with XRE-family HTH domain